MLLTANILVLGYLNRFQRMFWNLTGLSGGKAMETALLIALVIAGIYALYFVTTYYIACSYVLCCGETREPDL